MATLAGRLNRSWLGKIPTGLRWLLLIIILAVVAWVAIKFTVTSSADAVAQAPVAPAPAAQAVPPATAQTVQLTPAELTSLQNQLWHIIFAIERRPGHPATPQAAAQMDQFQRDFNYPAHEREVWIDGPVTQAANGTAGAYLKIQAWDRGSGNRRTPAWNRLVAERKPTMEFVLDQNKRITQVTNFRYR